MASVLDNMKEIHKIADLAEPKVEKAFLDIIAQIKDTATVGKIAKALKSGNSQAVFDALPTNLLTTEMQPKVAKIVRDVIEQSAAVAPMPGKAVASLDITNPKALEYVQNGLLNTSLKIRDETEQAVRDAIRKSFAEGIPTLDIAREIQDRVGLTSRQWASVDKYEDYVRGLADNISHASELSETALAKLQRGGLRGTGAFNSVQGLTESRISSLVQTYKDRLIRERSETIARTVTIDASNNGQRTLWRQAVQSGLLNDADWEVMWIIAPDDITCVRCREQGKMRSSIMGRYPNGVDHPTLHPR